MNENSLLSFENLTSGRGGVGEGVHFISFTWILLQVKTILVAMATKILELVTKLEPKSPAWQLKLRRRIESVS